VTGLIESPMNTAAADDDLVPPKSLYKFKPPPRANDQQDAERHRRLVERSSLWFASPPTLNDPFDCMPAIVDDATEDDFERYLRSVAPRKLAGLSESDRAKMLSDVRKRLRSATFLRETFLQHLQSHGVVSLTETCTEPLLWAHYAEGHRGYCVELDVTDQIELLRRETLLPLRVQYTARRPVVGVRMLLRALSREVEVPVLEWLTTKDLRWQYEREWRLVAEPGSVCRPMPSHCVRSVILGSCCSSETESQLRRWCATRENPVLIRRARAAHDTFDLSIVGADD